MPKDNKIQQEYYNKVEKEDFDACYLSVFTLKSLQRFEDKWKGKRISIPVKYAKR